MTHQCVSVSYRASPCCREEWLMVRGDQEAGWGASGELSPSIITKKLWGLWYSEFGATKTLPCTYHDFPSPKSHPAGYGETEEATKSRMKMES